MSIQKVESVILTSDLKKMKESTRYASVDFLRGASIFTMVVLHTILDVLDINGYIERMNSIGLINIVAFIVIPFIGGLAGIFLMASAIGNMIAIQKNIAVGHPFNQILRKQVVIGLLILFFGVLSEAFIGYNGVLGNLILDPNTGFTNELHTLSRMYHIETIHTIGWAIILNVITHSILVKKYDSVQEVGKIIRAYWILGIIILIATPLIWTAVADLVGGGYPYAIDPATDQERYLPLIGVSPWHEFITFFFLNPLAAPIEPIFPYLAVSYVGSIIGLQLTRKDFDRSFVKSYFKFGSLLLVIGYIGIIIVVGGLINEQGIEAGLLAYKQLPFHRYYTAEHGLAGGWIWQFISLNGLALMFTMCSIRISEYRGHAASFANRTKNIRRFGFVAFTIYTFQFIYYLVHLAVSYIFGFGAYSRMPWNYTWVTIILSLLLIHWILLKWERHGYIGSLEWAMSLIANKLNRIKKQTSIDDTTDMRWYEKGKLNVEGVFYNPTWVNFPISETTYLEDEKRLVKYCGLSGFLLFPFSFIGFYLVRDLERNHNTKVSKLKFLNIMGIIFFLFWLPLSLMISLSDLGVTL